MGNKIKNMKLFLGKAIKFVRFFHRLRSEKVDSSGNRLVGFPIYPTDLKNILFNLNLILAENGEAYQFSQIKRKKLMNQQLQIYILIHDNYRFIDIGHSTYKFWDEMDKLTGRIEKIEGNSNRISSWRKIPKEEILQLPKLLTRYFSGLTATYSVKFMDLDSMGTKATVVKTIDEELDSKFDIKLNFDSKTIKLDISSKDQIIWGQDYYNINLSNSLKSSMDKYSKEYLLNLQYVLSLKDSIIWDD